MFLPSHVRVDTLLKEIPIGYFFSILVETDWEKSAIPTKTNHAIILYFILAMQNPSVKKDLEWNADHCATYKNSLSSLHDLHFVAVSGWIYA